METLQPMEDVDLDIDPVKFGIRHKLARMVIGLKIEQCGKLYGQIGYKAGGVGRTQVFKWEKGEVSKVTRYMTKAASIVTGQAESYFLGKTPLDENVKRPFEQLPSGDDGWGEELDSLRARSN